VGHGAAWAREGFVRFGKDRGAACQPLPALDGHFEKDCGMLSEQMYFLLAQGEELRFAKSRSHFRLR
jgi:hypothetical protein